jgi:hypothetical protein
LQPKDENSNGSTENEAEAYSFDPKFIPIQSNGYEIKTQDGVEATKLSKRTRTPKKRTATKTQDADIKRPAKRIRKTTKPFVDQSIREESKSIVKKPMTYDCLWEGCSQEFMTLANLNNHQLEHNGVNVASFYHNTKSDNRNAPPHDETPPAIVQPEIKVESKKKIARKTEKKTNCNFKCQIDDCKRVFIKEENYEAHVKRHRGEKVCTSIKLVIFEIADFFLFSAIYVQRLQ